MASEKDDEINLVKMCGYLEKKGNKMKMMSSWKLKWFVLKGRLLLYYRSKDEYEACRGPCKGAINLGPNCIVKPLLGTSCVFQIETRAKTIILRAKNRLEQEKWLQSILSVLNQHQASSNIVGTQHFRYSSDELVPRQQQPKEIGANRALSRQNTMPERFKLKKRQTFCGSLENVLSKTCEKNFNKKCLSTQNITYKKSEEVINDLYSTNESELKSGGNIYYRISKDSNESNESNESKNDVVQKSSNKENIYTKINYYVTQNEMDDVENKNQEELVENDQYGTAAIKIIETKSNQYHEYNLPGKDNIYSVPNVDQNENKISKIDDVNPYSICDIFPKKNLQEESIYDVPIDVFGDKKEKIDELQIEELKIEEEKKPQLPKKVNFLKKFFKLKPRKEETETAKTIKNDNEKFYDGDLVNRKVLEELQKLLVAKKAILQQQNQKNPDLATKRMLEELQNLLINKKEIKLSKINIENPPDPPQKQPETIYQEITDSNPNSDNHTYANTALIKIDKILNDLDNMKKTSNPFSTGKVKSIIAKFNNPEINDSINVTLREKTSNFSSISSKNSSDELNLLLSELVKVTNAPILTPGVTISLNAPPISYTDEFEPNSGSIKKRRHSEPDYDVPRPHSNLNIIKNEVDKDDVFEATRFFGPVLLNYDDFSNASTSITPDSLEISEASSYQSHYGKILKQPPYFLHKPRKSDVNDKEDVFVDSLDAEGTTFL